MSKTKFTQSKASILLHDVDEILVSSTARLTKCKDPVNRVCATITELDNFAKDADDLLKDLKNVLKFSDRALLVGGKLSKLIPEAGPVISNVLSAIRKLKVEKGLENAIGQIETIVKNAREVALKELAAAGSTIQTGIQETLDKLPTCHSVLAIITQVSYLIDVVIYVAQPNLKEGFVIEAIDPIVKTFEGAKTKITAVKEVLDPLEEAMRNKVEPFIEQVAKLKQALDFTAIKKSLEPITSELDGFVQKVDAVVSFIEEEIVNRAKKIPVIGWLLSLIETVEEALSDVLSGIIKATGLGQLIQRLANVLEQELHLEEIKNTVKAGLDDCVNDVMNPLKELAKPEKIKHMLDSTEEALDTFQGMVKDPAKALINFVKDVIQFPSEPGIININELDDDVPPPPAPSPEALALFHIESDPSQYVTDTQKALDIYMRTAQPSSRQFPTRMLVADPTLDTRPKQTVLTSPWSAPTFASASLGGAPVSLLMRASQARIAERQALQESLAMVQAGGLRPLSVGGTLPNANSDHRPVMISTAEASPLALDKVPSFKNFSLAYSQILEIVEQVRNAIRSARANVTQAEVKLGALAPQSAELSKFLGALLARLDPISGTSTAVLDMILEYQSAIAQDLGKLFGALGFTGTEATIIPTLFGTLETIKHSFGAVVTAETAVKGRLEPIAAQYQHLNDRVALARSHSQPIVSKEFDKTNLCSIMDAVEIRVSTTSNCLALIESTGLAFFQDSNRYGAKVDDAAKIFESLFRQLAPVLEELKTKFSPIPGLLSSSSGDALTTLGKDVDLLNQLSQGFYDQCHVTEAKVLAADWMQALCDRIKSVLGPIKTILAELHVVPDPPQDSKSPLSALKPIVVTLAPSSASEKSKFLPAMAPFLSVALYKGIEELLKRHFHLSDLSTSLETFENALKHPFDKDLDAFDNAVTQLGLVLERPSGEPMASSTFFNQKTDDFICQSLSDISKLVVKQ